MSTRRDAKRLSPLDQQFSDRGLLRPGAVARALGVTVDQVMPLMRGNAIKCVTFDWQNQRMRGVPIEEVERIASKLA